MNKNIIKELIKTDKVLKDKVMNDNKSADICKLRDNIFLLLDIHLIYVDNILNYKSDKMNTIFNKNMGKNSVKVYIMEAIYEDNIKYICGNIKPYIKILLSNIKEYIIEHTDEKLYKLLVCQKEVDYNIVSKYLEILKTLKKN